MALLLAWFVVAGVGAIDVAYFRDGPAKTALNITAGNASAWLETYDETIEIWDSPRPVHAYRVVITGTPGTYAALYPGSAGLALAHGAYVFANATYNVTGGGKTRHVRYFDGVAWLRGAARFDVWVDKAGASMLFFVSSGPLDLGGGADAGALSALVGKADLAANAVPYALAGACYEGATHGDVADYSNLDEPIGPLAAHYHTRGALYHVLYGSAKFNDANVGDDTLRAGGVRFVNAGIFYGPEEMDRSASWVISLHEPDPSRVAAAPGPRASQCPFACFDDPNATSRCTHAAAH